MKLEFKTGSVDDLLTIENQIPEFVTPRKREEVEDKLRDKQHLLLMAYAQGKPVGYKLGHELPNNEFYSWLGAVIPEYRGKGIAKQLLVMQETWCQTQGYSAIRVKSRNRFKNMLLMLISRDYQIVKCEKIDGSLDYKIHFYKQLQ
ncbi:GNAT family N-acetyltransferase [Pseudoalteromonas piscicida]|uniref:GNAT family N-acetyltransferase n=1 Tax=Pseudoalteromonas piscicida TaxID=43662 RepID=A0A2A5JTL6_PSEO7|nr:GNAT family N-acetyltransferase [Pseudoalteromonas piscicida]PCK32803.1 GNAT family N-acetyltransferase [Pseudoalteromonas piscicida]